jgi:phosphate transport system permease protein
VAILQPLSTGTAAEVVQEQLRAGGKADVKGAIFSALLRLSLVLTLGILAVLLLSVFTDGWQVLSERPLDFLTARLRSVPEEAGVLDGLRGSFWIGLLVIVGAFPVGIGAGIYLEEYAPRNRLTQTIDVAIRNLAGVPSIVYGVLGFAIFVKVLGWLTGPDLRTGGSLLAAGITIAILVLPIVIITAAEAIRAVPDSIREAGFGVGATRWEVVRSHVLPYAAPGILTGTVLALARALGEAAPLILLGAVTGRLGGRPAFLELSQLQERFTAMPIVITEWAGRPQEGFRLNTAAAIVVLLAFVLLFNAAAILLRNRYDKERQG